MFLSDTQDLEASTWPATAAEVASTLLGLTNKLYMGVEATSTRLRGHEEIDPLRLTQAARTLKKNNTLGLETVCSSSNLLTTGSVLKLMTPSCPSS
jgi:hypothetical protein